MTKRIFKSFFAVISLAVVLPALFTSCEPVETGIPDCEVYIKRNIDIYKLFDYGSYLYIDKRVIENDRIGYGGIIIVKAFDGLFYAFDLTCTKEKDNSIIIGKPNEMLVCTCESCGEQYDLSFGGGAPTKSISKLPLKRYSTSIDGLNNIYVTP